MFKIIWGSRRAYDCDAAGIFKHSHKLFIQIQCGLYMQPHVRKPTGQLPLASFCAYFPCKCSVPFYFGERERSNNATMYSFVEYHALFPTITGALNPWPADVFCGAAHVYFWRNNCLKILRTMRTCLG
jgi:hypothetical protein